MHNTPLKRSLLALSILLALAPASHAAENPEPEAAALDKIVVTGQKEKKASANQNTVTVDAEQLQADMANTLEDAIRYIPGVEINDMGLRFGDNGINIRGLSGDRVSMRIDGMEMPEQVESLAAQLYDFFRAGRGSPDIDTLKQIDISKGADSITGGSGALGGSISFTSKDPYDYLAPEGNDSYFGLKLGHASASDENHGTFTFANRSGKFESMLVYTRRQGHETESWYGDDSPAQTGPDRRSRDPLDFDSHNLLAKLQFLPTPAHRIGLLYERSRGESTLENLGRVQGANTAYIERWGDDETRRDRYGLSWEWQAHLAAFDTLEARLDQQKSESLALTRILGLSASCTSRTVACWRLDDRSGEQMQNQFTLDFAKQWGQNVRHQLIYGLGWRSRDLAQVDYRSFQNDSGEVIVNHYLQGGRLPDIDTRHWNLYLRDRIRLLDDQLGLTLGARYDHYRYEATATRNFPDRVGVLTPATFAAASWSAGLDWRLTPQQTLWLQTGRGFRAPSASDMFLNLSSSLATNVATGEEVYYWNQASNPDLRAEKSLNLELGWRWHGERARWGVSVFRDTYDNLITTGYLTRTPDITYRICTGSGASQTCREEVGNRYNAPINGLKATVTGYEIEGMVRLGEPWLLRAAWSAQNGEFADGTPMETISPARAVLGLGWTSPAQHWRLNAHLVHTLAKKAGDVATLYNAFTGNYDRPLSNAWTTVDLTAIWQPNRHWRVQAGIYNLFDREYIPWPRLINVVVSPFVQHGGVTQEGLGRYSAPGRNFRATVSYRF